jgi:ferric-dicitrate binding protein FerR (iron transport regulator)
MSRHDDQFAAEMLRHLPLVPAPDHVWNAIEAALAHPPARPQRRHWPLVSALAAAAAVGAFAYLSLPHGTRWDVVRIHGVERTAGHIRAGQSIETDASSRAIVTVGTIGTVDVSPGTKLRVVAAKPGEHRLALERGEIHATIFAPPRLFFVDTASGTAIDLGCEYSLHTDENGEGLLRVTRGWVEFQWHGVESLVPAGASCRTTSVGPGVPCFDDAPENLKQALDRTDSLAALLSAARVRDTLTLWHLLARVAPAEREQVYDRMAALAPVPAGVTRDLALRLDPATLARWKDELAWTW